MSTEKKRRESTHTKKNTKKRENLFVLKTDKNEYCVDPYKQH